MSEKKEIEIQPVRPLAYVVGVIAVVLVVTFVGFLSLFSAGGVVFSMITNTWDETYYVDTLFVFFWPLLFAIIASAVMKGGKGLSRQELALIVSMVWVSWAIPTYYGVMSEMVLVGTARAIPAFQKWTMDYGAVNNWKFGPDPKAASLWDPWMYGGPVPWGAWMTPIAIWMISVLPFYLSFLFLIGLVRRLWVDIEFLPFPLAEGVSHIIKMSYNRNEKGRSEIFRNGFLWLGIVVGVVAISPYWVPRTIPSLGWTLQPDTDRLGIDLTPLNLVMYWPLNIHFEAWEIALSFLVPLVTLQSYIVMTFITYFIFPQIMYQSGLWDAVTAGTSTDALQYNQFWRGWSGPLQKAWVYTWGAWGWFPTGAIMGLVFYPMFVFRGEIKQTIKVIFGKGDREFESKEPMRYRYLFAGWVICMLLYLVVWWWKSEGNLPIGAGIIWVIGCQLYYGLAAARTRAEFGEPMNFAADDRLHVWNYTTKAWSFADKASPFYIRDVPTRYLAVRADLFYCGEVIRANPAFFVLDAFKLGSMTGLHSKHIFLGSFIAIVVGVITAWFTLIPMWHYYGATNLTYFAFTGAPNNHPQRGPTYACISETGAYERGMTSVVAGEWVTFAVGAAVVIFTYIMKARYTWFPLNAAGVAMGSGWMPFDILFPVIIAYVAKMLIVRFGGALYEKKALPFAIGLAISLSIAVIVNNLSLAAATKHI